MHDTFQVIWRRVLIEKQLAEIVVSLKQKGKSSKDVTAAMAEIDRLLAEDPHAQGESRPDFERILIVSPLAVSYEVHDDERIVYVLRLSYLPSKSQRDSDDES